MGLRLLEKQARAGSVVRYPFIHQTKRDGSSPTCAQGDLQPSFDGREIANGLSETQHIHVGLNRCGRKRLQLIWVERIVNVLTNHTC